MINHPPLVLLHSPQLFYSAVSSGNTLLTLLKIITQARNSQRRGTHTIPTSPQPLRLVSGALNKDSLFQAVEGRGLSQALPRLPMDMFSVLGFNCRLLASLRRFIDLVYDWFGPRPWFQGRPTRNAHQILWPADLFWQPHKTRGH